VYLIDTNVVGEARKRDKANPGCLRPRSGPGRGCLRVPRAESELDKQIAATAMVNDLTVVTRNTTDFAGMGVRMLNPFQQT
jgi:hypothetical protein